MDMPTKMFPLRLKIDESFFEPEERDGYVISAEMKQIWAVELDLLNEFAKVCSEYHLKWFVHAGTMLGAVRHHGFIPWDDDIDVIMPREDYGQLCLIGASVFHEPYFFQNEDTDRFFCRNFSRLRNSKTTAIQLSEKEFGFPFNQGIFIDIFPIDNVPDDDRVLQSFFAQAEHYSNNAWQYRNMVHFYHPKKGKGLSKRVKYFIKHVWYSYVDKRGGDYNRLLKEHRELLVSFNGMDTRRVGEIVISPLGRHVWHREWLNDSTYMPFEMLQVPVPSDYRHCLAASYGEDWENPKRAGNYHGQVLFDANRPYTDYLLQ